MNSLNYARAGLLALLIPTMAGAHTSAFTGILCNDKANDNAKCDLTTTEEENWCAGGELRDEGRQQAKMLACLGRDMTILAYDCLAGGRIQVSYYCADPPAPPPAPVVNSGGPTPASTDDVTTLLLKGDEALLSKNYPEAMHFYSTALLADPSNLRAQQGMQNALAGASPKK